VRQGWPRQCWWEAKHGCRLRTYTVELAYDFLTCGCTMKCETALHTFVYVVAVVSGEQSRRALGVDSLEVPR
jgi:hypothetical protein